MRESIICNLFLSTSCFIQGIDRLWKQILLNHWNTVAERLCALLTSHGYAYGSFARNVHRLIADE